MNVKISCHSTVGVMALSLSFELFFEVICKFIQKQGLDKSFKGVLFLSSLFFHHSLCPCLRQHHPLNRSRIASKYTTKKYLSDFLQYLKSDTIKVIASLLNPLSTKKIPCKLYHWGPMDPRFQKSI